MIKDFAKRNVYEQWAKHIRRKESVNCLTGFWQNVSKMNKLAGVTEMVISLNELSNSDDLEDGKPSKVLLRHYLTSSEVFTNFEPVSPQYKKLKDAEFTSLTLRIKDQITTV